MSRLQPRNTCMDPTVRITIMKQHLMSANMLRSVAMILVRVVHNKNLKNVTASER